MGVNTDERISSYMDQYEQDRDRLYNESYHMGYKDALDYESQIIPEILRSHSGLNEDDFYNSFIEEILNKQDKENEQERNDTKTKESGVDRGSEILSGEESDIKSGVRTSENQNGNIPSGLQSNGEGEPIFESTPGKEVTKNVPDLPPAQGGNAYADKLSDKQEKEQQTLNNIADERKKVDVAPTEAQKEAGNYKKGHVNVDGYDITIENPKGSERSGKNSDGKSWSVRMHNDYGYIKNTEGVDGDHVDIFLSDSPNKGNVFVVDQINPDGSFDEHKVMYGFANADEAKAAYLSNYANGWKGLGNITEVSKDEFKKWINSSTRKTKPFEDYKSVKTAHIPDATKMVDEKNVLARVDDAVSSLVDAIKKHNDALNDFENNTEDQFNKTFSEVVKRKNELGDVLQTLSDNDFKNIIDKYGKSSEENTDVYDEIKDEKYRRENAVEIKDDFDKGIAKQGELPDTEESKSNKYDPYASASKDELRPKMQGMYHGDGYGVTSNGFVLVADKTVYDKKHDGKIISKDGKEIDGKYPAWKSVIPKVDTTIDAMPQLETKMNTVEKLIKSAWKKAKANGEKTCSLANYYDYKYVVIKFPYGSVIAFKYKTLKTFVDAAKHLGTNNISYRKGFVNKPIYTDGKNGLAFVMPYVISRDDVDNCYLIDLSNAKAHDTHKQQGTSMDDLSNDTKAAQAATDAIVEALNNNKYINVVVEDSNAVPDGAKKQSVKEDMSGNPIVDSVPETSTDELGSETRIGTYTYYSKSNGNVYGWAVGNEIHLTKDGLNPNTPIHEYTHLWATAMMKANPKEWDYIKNMLKCTPVWEEVLNDKNYQDIKDNDDDVASEVLSRISGRENSKRVIDDMQEAINEAKENGKVLDVAKKTKVLNNIKNAIQKFWNWVCKDLFNIRFMSVDEVADRVLYDLVNGTELKGDNETDVIISDAVFASEDEIDKYMRERGFEPTKKEAEYSNGEYIVSDLHPRNVIKDAEGRICVIDADVKTAHIPDATKMVDKKDVGVSVFEKKNSVPDNTTDTPLTENEKTAFDAITSLIGDKDIEIVDATDEMAENALNNGNAQRQAYVKSVNDKFNEELDEYRDGSFKGKFSLGLPSEIIKTALSIPDSEIEMTQSTLSKHLKKHNLSIDDIRNLVDAFQKPMMIYTWGEKAKSGIVITNITKDDGRKITVALKLERNGEKLDINEVASIHGKDLERLVKEMNTTKTEFGKGNLKWADKEKVLEWLSMDSPKESSTTNQELSSAAKIVKDFDNPIISDENVQKQIVSHGSGNDFDKFDFSHMGEGEGAQAYGWGGYVTEVNGIAKTYTVTQE